MRTQIISDPALIEEVIRRAPICYVGMTTAGGAPYVIPMNFGYRNGVVYLHSAPEGKHLDALQADNRVCITFCTPGELKYQHVDVACSYSMKAVSVLCSGRVTFIDDLDRKRDALQVVMEQYTGRTDFAYSDPALRNVRVWQVVVDEATCKSFGNQFKSE